MGSFDVLIIGGGMAGASIGYELAAGARVGLLEMESQLGFHTTGRSVATFLESYGGRTIRLLTTASRDFMNDPPDGFGDGFLTPLPLMWIARNGEEASLASTASEVAELVIMTPLSAAEVVEHSPTIRPDWVAGGLLEPGASEIDVAALHQGYVGGLKRRGGEVLTSRGVAGMEPHGGGWLVTDVTGGVHDAKVVVNASGAWADVVAALAGVPPIGIHPLRRTVFTFSPPAGLDLGRVPLIGDINGSFYFKREGDNVLASPADEVPSEPCDAKVDELDVARAIDLINEATRFEIRHVKSSWAGLRSFVNDRSPVACFDDSVDGFFWFVGQGGYGIQMAPALARAAAALIESGALPSDLAARGLDAAALHRRRLVGLPDLTTH